MSTLAERLAQAMEGPPKIRPIDLARACGVKQPSVSGWLSGKSTRMEGANLLAAAEFLNVNYWWLADGREPMRPTDVRRLGPLSMKAPERARPKWPFPSLSEDAVSNLPAADRYRIEGALALAVAQVGIDIDVEQMVQQAGPSPALSRLDQAEAIIRAASVEAANDADYLAIRKVSVKITAGVPGFATEYQRDDGTGGLLYLARQWVEKNRYRVQALHATTVKRNSMFPHIKEGDTVVFNTDDTTERADQVFAVNHEGEFTLKRLKKRLGHWYLYSDNEDQKEFPPVMCTALTFIIGKIVLLHRAQI